MHLKTIAIPNKTIPGWRDFIKTEIKDRPSWQSETFYRFFDNNPGMQWLGGSAREQIKEKKETLQMWKVDFSPMEGGAGLVIGFGLKPEELPTMADVFGLQIIHGVDWIGSAVEKAAQYLHQNGYSPDYYSLYHSHGPNLGEFISPSSIDVIYGYGLEGLTVRDAEAFIHVLKPGGLLFLSSTEKQEFLFYLQKYGVFILDIEGPIYFQKFPVSEETLASIRWPHFHR